MGKVGAGGTVGGVAAGNGEAGPPWYYCMRLSRKSSAQFRNELPGQRSL
jgi:hypothetical protein